MKRDAERIARMQAISEEEARRIDQARILERREERLNELHASQGYQNFLREVENSERTPEHEPAVPTAPSESPENSNSPLIGSVNISVPDTTADAEEDKPPTYEECLTNLKLKGMV